MKVYVAVLIPLLLSFTLVSAQVDVPFSSYSNAFYSDTFKPGDWLLYQLSAEVNAQQDCVRHLGSCVFSAKLVVESSLDLVVYGDVLGDLLSYFSFTLELLPVELFPAPFHLLLPLPTQFSFAGESENFFVYVLRTNGEEFSETVGNFGVFETLQVQQELAGGVFSYNVSKIFADNTGVELNRTATSLRFNVYNGVALSLQWEFANSSLVLSQRAVLSKYSLPGSSFMNQTSSVSGDRSGGTTAGVGSAFFSPQVRVLVVIALLSVLVLVPVVRRLSHE